MNIILWILQALLAIAFFGHAYGMLFPVASQMRQMPYIMAIPTPFRRLIAVVEALGGVGLILPPLIHIWPWLAAWAATGLVILMLSAIVFHIRRHESPNIVFNLILLVLAAVVAYGRFVIAPL